MFLIKSVIQYLFQMVAKSHVCQINMFVLKHIFSSVKKFQLKNTLKKLQEMLRQNVYFCLQLQSKN